MYVKYPCVFQLRTELYGIIFFYIDDFDPEFDIQLKKLVKSRNLVDFSIESNK